MVAAPPLGSLARGDRVEVWSSSAKAWQEGRVEAVFPNGGAADGYTIPAGCIKVSSTAGVKYVMPGEAQKLLRLAAADAAGRAEPGHGSRGCPRPPGRQKIGAERLEARDRWNTYEIRLQEIFMEYDRDRSGTLELEEFCELLRDFNEGAYPSEEEYDFMMRLCDKDHDGKISLGELNYALRAWHSYRRLDGTVLRLFAAFDTDASGGLDPVELQGLLTAMNAGLPVPMEEVLHVMEQAGVCDSDVVSRTELLGAIACWYARVGRRSTDLFTLLHEAAVRMAQEGSQQGALNQGMRGIGRATSGAEGYAPVPLSRVLPLGATAGLADSLPTLELQEAGEGHGAHLVASQSRVHQAAPHCVRSCSSLCYASSPFLLGWVMAFCGWHHRVNECPRNLDGILLWFGLLVLLLGSLNHVRITDPSVERAQLAVSVILAALSMVGLLWTLDVDVQDGQDLCGRSLVWWSRLTWVSIPTCGCGYGCYALAWQMKRLRIKDARLQNEIVL